MKEQNRDSKKITLILEKIISETLLDKLTWERNNTFGVYLLKLGSATITITKNSLFRLDVDFCIYNEDGYCIYDSSCKYFMEDSELYNKFFSKVEEDVLSKDTTIDSILNELINK